MSSSSSEQALSHSMTDLMTSLAVIFILLLVVYMNHSYQETQQGSLKIKERLIKKLNDELKSSVVTAGVTAEDDPQDPLALLIRVQDQTLQFDVDKAILKPPGQAFMRVFTPKLTNTLCSKQFNNDVESVLIEGFTDHTGAIERNLALSQERSLAVLQFALNSSGITPQTKECLLDLSSTNGRGDRDLLPFDVKTKKFAQRGTEDRQKSRRVEFKIRVKSFELRKGIEEK